ncbi:MAG: Serine/threonine-protein kinase PknD [Phycisphaerae bacterium]|nr:Serine/threonine-protein kinase PknD [Phycisphaerae bacterium]
MSFLNDALLEHLRGVADRPDLGDPRYEVLARIGRGGMGNVYRVEDRLLGRQVALKVVNDGLPQEVAERMLREARILAQLEHPGIVPIHDAGRLPDGRLYCIMKLVEGRRLDALAGDALPVAERIRILMRVCEAVAFAHSQGVLHRDLKPENVMVGEFGEVLVLDWGVAKAVSPTGSALAAETTDATVAGLPPSQATSCGAVIGTSGYMSPEQSRGEAGGLDERTDVYGLGAILYCLLTGRAPHADAVTSAAIVPPRVHDRSIARALEAACLRALDADAGRRYPSAQALHDDLARFLLGQRVSAHRESLVERVERWVWKYRTPLLLVVTYLLMRVVVQAWLQLKEDRPTLERTSPGARQSERQEDDEHE